MLSTFYTEHHESLAHLKERMIAIATNPLRSEYARLGQVFRDEYEELKNEQQRSKLERRVLRDIFRDDQSKLQELDRISQTEKQAKKRLKAKWQTILGPMEAEIAKLDRELYDLRQEYKIQARLLQQSLAQDYRPGGLVEIIHYETDFVVVAKPPGLLSVPGRYGSTQDSVYLRLKQQLQTDSIFVIHRLDQATSGVLIFALNENALRHFTNEWHQTTKIYEALLPGSLSPFQGTIDLPLSPARPPRQRVTIDGKPSLTEFLVLSRTADCTRLELYPRTGRTHQLRVHCLAFFGVPILGDRLYGCPGNLPRLYLHARELVFSPHRSFVQPTPF